MRPWASFCAGEGPGDGPVRVLRVDPKDGATGVFRDASVIARLSHPVLASSVTAEAFAVEDDAGAIPGRLTLSADGRFVLWRAERLMVPGVAHRVKVAGLTDVRGRTVAPHQSGFVPCDLTLDDVFG